MARSVSSNLALASLQKSMPLVNATDTYPAGVTLSFLESQITSCHVLQSATEFKHWIFTTVTHLLEKGPECRLRSILDDLMGPTHLHVKAQKSDNILVN